MIIATITNMFIYYFKFIYFKFIYLQFENAPSHIVINGFKISIIDKFEHCVNALFPIYIYVFWYCYFLKFLQKLNAKSSISATYSGIINSVICIGILKILSLYITLSLKQFVKTLFFIIILS